MASSVTPRGKFQLGPGLVADYGDYNTDGSTVFTYSCSGGYVVFLQFNDANSNPLDGASTPAVVYSAKALSGSVTSITVTPSGGAITGGTYICIHGGE